MKRACLLLCALVLATAGFLVADDGFWLFNAVPGDKIQARYGFKPGQPWLDHARLSSVRFTGASGSFVSPDGLVLTNHHVASGCVHDVSTADKDYVKNGFYAPTKADELKCPRMSVSVLQEVQDITPKVKAAVTPNMSPVEAAKAKGTVISALTKECNAVSKLSCEAVPFYSGAMHFLYKYKTYSDVRLVFAPEYAVAFLGGDADNFEYPRYAFDVTFLRVYEDGKPLRATNYLKWSKNGAKEGELVLVTGHPGRSARLNTMAQLEYMRDLDYPMQIERQTRVVDVLLKRSAASDAARRQVEEGLFVSQNGLKAHKGYYSGVLDQKLMASKAEQEKRVRDAVLSNPKLKAEFGDPWKVIADYYAAQREGNLAMTRRFFPDPQPPAGPKKPGGAAGVMQGMLPALARLLVLAPVQKAIPEAERDSEYTDEAMQKRLLNPRPLTKDPDVRMLANSLAEMAKYLKDAPIVAQMLNGKTPEQAAQEWLANTQMDKLEFRKQLYDGGKEAIEKSTDPLIVAARLQQAEAFRVAKEWREKVVPRQAAADVARTKLAQARFAVEGLKYYPDANSTLRLSYGAVRGYVEDGRGTVAKGTTLPPFTTFGGAYDYVAKHGNKAPYELPESWLKAKDQIDPRVPLVVASTADILGGNSGSPLINRNAELVGLVFDGNIQSLPGNFQFDERLNRALSIDSRAILEALRKVYGAGTLAEELSGQTISKAATKAH